MPINQKLNIIMFFIESLTSNSFLWGKWEWNEECQWRLPQQVERDNWKKKDQLVIISIKDKGKGIDKEILPLLFNKFVTKSDQGTGLGLYIAKNIIEAHGGKIWAFNNNDGIGSTFVFSLPRWNRT